MFLSAQAFFEDMTPGNSALLIRMETEIPADFIRLYKRNVAPLTPMKTGALRRSIITQQLGGMGQISWRLPYAIQQNQGYHVDKTKHFVPASGYGKKGKGYMAMPGTPHYYRRYTTAGTGPHFANIAFQMTKDDMAADFRERGYVK